jgi:hypothetical protein
VSSAPEDLIEPPADPLPERVAEDDAASLLTSDAAFTLDEARAITSRRGATVVLPMGEVGTGKSTLLVEIWNQLMTKGAIGQTGFAGSATAVPFEARAFPSRSEAEVDHAETKRTVEESEGFLHLRLHRTPGGLTDLLIADVTGEHFRHVRQGTGLEDEIGWVRRVDKFVVLVDGAALTDPKLRENAINRCARLLMALAETSGRSASTRILLVVSKDDVVKAAGLDPAAMIEPLLVLARRSDENAVALRVSARPSDLSEPWGLDELLAFLVQAPVDERTPSPETPPAGRSFARFQA